jgi:uncharacterized protein YqeY
MANFIDQLKSDALETRRLAMANSQDRSLRVKASLLTTVISEAERVGKDAGGRAPSDEEVVTVLRKFAKNVDATLALQPDDARATQESGILSDYLPTPLTDDEVRTALTDAPAWLDLSMKNMKAVMEYMNSLSPGRITGQQLAAILKDGV